MNMKSGNAVQLRCVLREVLTYEGAYIESAGNNITLTMRARVEMSSRDEMFLLC